MQLVMLNAAVHCTGSLLCYMYCCIVLLCIAVLHWFCVFLWKALKAWQLHA
jgi:hypothetical protein